MMSSQDAASSYSNANIIAREAIRDCIYRYCRGFDRADVALLRSAFWPDATDAHGVYNGSAAGFIDWAITKFETIDVSIQQIHNILIDFREGGAAVESYVSGYQRQLNVAGHKVQLDLKGRYLDWFVERDGEWRMLDRLVIFDLVGERLLTPHGERQDSGLRQPVGRCGPDDPSYAFMARCDAR